MIVKAKNNKRITVVFTIACIIGVLFLCRIVAVLGLSAYINAESAKEDGNQELVAVYYIGQALTGDFMESYIAYYNAGTALAKADQPQAAEQYLGKALSKVDNDYNECYIRNNLAKVQEQLGDYYMIADMASTAESYYAKAITTVSESPGVCFPPPNGGGSGEGGDNPLTPQDQTPKDSENGENMKETKERSEQKEGESQEAQGKTTDGKEKVEEEMNQSKSEMDNQEDVSKQKDNQSNREVEKPW